MSALVKPHYEWPRGSDLTVPLDIAPREDMTLWTVEFKLMDITETTTLVTKTLAAGITLITSGDEGFMIVQRSDTLSIPAGLYTFNVWRRDPGFTYPLGEGFITLDVIAGE